MFIGQFLHKNLNFEVLGRQGIDFVTDFVIVIVFVITFDIGSGIANIGIGI